MVLVIRGGLETVRQGQSPSREKSGGRSFLCLVHQTVVHNQIPVVLFDGTGGCCDLFSKVDHLHREHRLKRADDERMRARVQEKTKAMLNELKRSSEDVDRQIDPLPLIFDCIDKASIYLTLIDFKNDHHFRGDIDLAILQALLNGNRRPMKVDRIFVAAMSKKRSTEINADEKRQQLALALQWNRVDIVKNFILKDDSDWTVSTRVVRLPDGRMHLENRSERSFPRRLASESSRLYSTVSRSRLPVESIVLRAKPPGQTLCGSSERHPPLSEQLHVSSSITDGSIARRILSNRSTENLFNR